MRIVYIFLAFFAIALNSFSNSTTDVCLITVKNDSTPDEFENEKTYHENNIQVDNLKPYRKRLKKLNRLSPIDLSYNIRVTPFIESYLNLNKRLIEKMKGLSSYYFPIFENMLDKYGLPLELKYLPIVESALNPKAKSSSGATGLWQFMYLTGIEYNLKVTSYIDERQDPIKSTEAACMYLKNLYEIFGDWHLVLAAYNGGPGYIQRKIEKTGKTDFWGLHEHLRTETRNYVPTFIAVIYSMVYAEEHGIKTSSPKIDVNNVDTLVLKENISSDVFQKITCLDKETLDFLNPSFKKDVYYQGSTIIVPKSSAKDFNLNQESYYDLLTMIEEKIVLIDEEMIEYNVIEGDYLGKIAKKFGVRVFEIKEWNNLTSTKLNINDKLTLFIKKETNDKKNIDFFEYTIKSGDTLWGISKKFKGVTISELRSLNNLSNDNLSPGTKIILPKT